MSRPGPLFTLLAGLVLAVFMLSLNATTGTRNTASAPAPRSTATTSPSASGAVPPSATAPSATRSAAPASSTAAPVRDAVYAGRTDDDSAAVSVSVRAGWAVAYFCDGVSEEAWLRGDVADDGTLHLTGEHGARLDGAVRGSRLGGTVDVGGGHDTFDAARAVEPSGLYRATATVRGVRVDGGWIVLPDGRQVGILRRGGKPSRAPAVDPSTGAVTVDGKRLTAGPVTP